MPAGPLGVYVHFPYCKQRCPYCDFATHARPRIPHDDYAAAVLAELDARAPLFDARPLVSLFFGGGTPSLWRADCVARVLAAVVARFDGVPASMEITLEANPGELPPEHLVALRQAGVNRLSIGVQSLAPRMLQLLGRIHGPTEPGVAVQHARAAGFDNLSLDLMFGMPGQTLADLDADLTGLLALAPEHVSIYNLTVEERTPFGAMQRAGTLRLPDTGLVAEMYERVRAVMLAHGYEHYEISNYARPGGRARHNSLYWSGGAYLGLGSSAHSFRVRADGVGERFANLRSVDDYLRAAPGFGGGAAPESDASLVGYEALTPEARARESVWLQLRLSDGVSRAAFARAHGYDPVQHHESEVARLLREGLVEVTDEVLRLSPRGILFADEVGARFV